ncbi:GerAB/ArcD/ProY family transporter [Cohnella sp. GCM10027633]|uniref:GerAB/ArcD/ProY family transporter n=1 Tax=unclassified Cohnella TaxID=2636738 RepID=UPI003637D56C
MNKTIIGNGMFVAMIVNLAFVKSIGVTQGTLARIVGQDMWLATLLGTLQGIVMMYVTYLVIRRKPNLDFIGMGEKLLGKWFGKIVAVTMFGFFLAASGPIMLTFVYHLRDYFLPEAPLTLFLVSALIVGALGCYYGLEVMARLALLGLLFIFMLNVLIIVGSTQEFDIRNLLPILESGFSKVAGASLQYDADCALAIMMAALVMPHLKDVKRRGGKLGMLGVAASGLIILIWSFLQGAVLSAEVTAQYTVSCMKLARNAHIGMFLQRYEMIMIALYSVPILFEIMFCIYGTSRCASALFGLKNDRWTILPAALIIGVFSYWVIKDHFFALDYLENAWPKIGVSIAFGLPVVLLVLQLLFGKRLKRAR